jgi:hypothetical protein
VTLSGIENGSISKKLVEARIAPLPGKMEIAALPSRVGGINLS